MPVLNVNEETKEPTTASDGRSLRLVAIDLTIWQWTVILAKLQAAQLLLLLLLALPFVVIGAIGVVVALVFGRPAEQPLPQPPPIEQLER